MSNSKSKPVLLFVIFAVILLGIIVSSLPRKQSIVSKAESAVCDSRCLHEDPCCAQMVAQQDYTLCEWADPRGYCKPETCNKLGPGLENRGRCGWYWSFHDAAGSGLGTNTPQGYGCMIGSSAESMRPICDGGGEPTPKTPTNTPKPTRKPTKTPKVTQTPTSEPEPTTNPTSPFQPSLPVTPSTTHPKQINETPVFYNGTQTTNQSQTEQPSGFSIVARFISISNVGETIQFPSSLGMDNVEKQIQNVDIQAPKALNFFTWIFHRITFLDRVLELKVNTTLHNTFNRFFGE